MACARAVANPDENSDFTFETPQLIALSPGQITVGSTVQLIGRSFIDPDHGTLRVHLSGIFTDDTGAPNHYEDDVPVTFRNRGLADFEFGPSVLFSPSGDRIGTFHGSAAVVSQLASTGDERSSDPVDVSVQVLPSILIEAMHSVDGQCGGVSKSTIENQNLAIAVKAIGLGDDDPSDPVTFRFHVRSPGVQAAYVKDVSYAYWPLNLISALDAPAHASSPDGDSYFEITPMGARVAVVDPQSQQRVVAVSPPVTIGQETFTQVKLAQFATGKLGGPGYADADLFVEVSRGNGDQTIRHLALRVYQQQETRPYDGNTKLVERFQPEQVSACYPGGDIGRDISYTETQAETRSRSVAFHWDYNVGGSLGLNIGSPTGPAFSWVTLSPSFDANWAHTFGVSADESVSSEQSVQRGITAHILPTFFGVCYRQTEQIERTVDLVFHTPCGQSGTVGQGVLTDWNWGFDIASGAACPPPTDLPPAAYFGDGG
jgi:hypothetical protein